MTKKFDTSKIKSLVNEENANKWFESSEKWLFCESLLESIDMPFTLTENPEIVENLVERLETKLDECFLDSITS